MKSELEELFGLLNKRCQYLILRNWDHILDDDIYGSGHEDIDILCNNVDDFVSLVGTYRVYESSNRDNYEVWWGSLRIRFDIRWVGDGYYPEKWERDMLQRRVYSRLGIYIPCPEDHFFSLSYHALLQKPILSNEYLGQLRALNKELNKDDEEIDEGILLEKLSCYLEKRNLKIEMPKDPGVYINWDNIGRAWKKNVRFLRLRYNYFAIIRRNIIYYAKCAYLYLKTRALKEKISNQHLISFLEKGEYKLLYRKTMLLIKRDVPIEFVTKIAEENCMYNVGRYSVLRNKEGHRKSQAVIITANSYRFFDFNTDTSFYLFENENQRERLKKAVAMFSPFFYTTVISVEKNCSVEKLVNFIHRKKWSDYVVLSNYYHIIELYIDFLKSSRAKGLLYTKANCFEMPEGLKIPEEDVDLFSSLFKIPIVKTMPHTFCHCDMHFGNILQDHDSGELFLIDFEYARDEVFFYDFFNIMYVEYTDYHNSMLLDLYLDENITMISHFERAFDVVGYKFDKNLKLFYLEYFLYSRMMFYTIWEKNKLKGKQLEKKLSSIIINIHLILEYIRQHEGLC